MFGELEDAKHSQDAYEDEGAAASGALAVALGLLDAEYHKVRHDRHQVEQVHDVPQELQLRGTDGHAQHKLHTEPDDAHLPPYIFTLVTLIINYGRPM